MYSPYRVDDAESKGREFFICRIAIAKQTYWGTFLEGNEELAEQKAAHATLVNLRVRALDLGRGALRAGSTRPPHPCLPPLLWARYLHRSSRGPRMRLFEAGSYGVPRSERASGPKNGRRRAARARWPSKAPPLFLAGAGRRKHLPSFPLELVVESTSLLSRWSWS